MILLILATALSTPLPIYSSSPSLNSNASFVPVDAPLGTIALALIPQSRLTIQEIVGRPLESKT